MGKINIKEYPKRNGKELSKNEKEIFNLLESEILWNREVLKGTEAEGDFEVIAYNSAFCILTDILKPNIEKIIKEINEAMPAHCSKETQKNIDNCYREILENNLIIKK